MKKLFIKLLAICLVTIVAVSASGCACGCSGTPALSLTANWFDKNTEQTQTLTENVSYNVSYLSDWDGLKATNKEIEVVGLSGTYNITFNSDAKSQFNAETFGFTAEETEELNKLREEMLKSKNVDNNANFRIYKYVTALNVTGSYKYKSNGQVVDFTDSIVTTVYFTNYIDNYKPLYSKKVVATTTPYASSIDQYQYTVETFYKGKKASVTLTPLDEETKEYFVKGNLMKKDAEEKVSTIKKVGSYYDNEQLIFLMRGMELKKKANITVPIVDTTGLRKNKVAIKVTADAETVKIENFNGQPETEISCFKTTISLSNGNYSGASKTAYFSASADYQTYHNILVQYVDALPHNVGALQYTLASYART